MISMDMDLLWTFIILNVLNVIIQTIKSLMTVKCGKCAAAIANAVAYGLYTVVVVYMVCELPLLLKVIIVGSCNLVGVFLVKWGEEFFQKDKLWKVELTVPTQFKEQIDAICSVPHSFIELSDKHTLFNFYCENKTQSQLVKNIASKYNAKYFVAENKNLY